jgi:hypothetical protein
MPRWARLYRRIWHAPIVPRSAAEQHLGRLRQCYLPGCSPRAIAREDAALSTIYAELELAAGGNPLLYRAIRELKYDFAEPGDLEMRARSLTERLGVALQASLLV